MYRLLLTVCSVLFFKLGFAQDDSLFIRKLADEILVNSKAYTNLHTLTKTVGQRLSGSPQTYKAEEWGKQALKDAGAEYSALLNSSPQTKPSAKENATPDPAQRKPPARAGLPASERSVRKKG